jgi:predicted Zn-dependent protease
MKYTPREIHANVNVSARSPLKECFLLLGGVVGILVILYVGLGLAVDLVVAKLPPEIELSLGKLYADTFAKDPQTAAEKYLQTVLDSLVKESSLSAGKYYIHLLPSSQVNALALPGGHIVVLSALIEEVASENELAFILAHELGHFENRDHLRGLGRGLVLTAISALFFGVDHTLTNFLLRSLFTVEMKFSQHQETAADLFALDLLHTRYGHIAGATDFFEDLAREEPHGRLAYFFATHPYPQDRVQTLREYIQQQKYSSAETLPLDASLEGITHTPESGSESLKDILGH